MGKYTVELRELVEQGVDLGLKTYPIWSEEHREELNQKIINHYKYREIGFETPGRFIEELNIKMHEIMPYYIKLYETTLYEYNPIHNVDYTEENTTTRDSEGSLTNKEIGTSEGSGTVKGDSESTSESNITSETNHKNKKVDVDTPQNRINVDTLTTGNLDYASNVSAEENLENQTQSNSGSASSHDTSTTTTESNLTTDFNSESEKSELETFKKHLSGNYGVTTSQNMIKQEREIIINIDMQIIGQLRNLFMQVW